jgi:Sigma-70, region 4
VRPWIAYEYVMNMLDSLMKIFGISAKKPSRAPAPTREKTARPRARLRPEEVSEILRLHASGQFKLREIGERFGVTRERVRQLAQERGLAPRRLHVEAQRQVKAAEARRQAEERKAGREAARLSPNARVRIASREWVAGMPRGVIAQLTGFPNGNALSVTICAHWRKRWPHLFPYRKAYGGRPKGFVGEPDLRPYKVIDATRPKRRK